MRTLYRRITILCLAVALCLSVPVLAAPAAHTVKAGESLWVIANKYQIGLSEIKKANTQIKNFDLIYPGQVINIPEASPLKTFEEEVARLVNAERAKAGLAPLTLNWQLSRVARYKSQDMIDRGYFAHQSPTYGSPFDMIESFGIRFSAAAENIAYGQKTPADVMKSWMSSPGHRSNILSGNVSEIGVGAAKAYNGTFYWTQLFIRPIR